MAKFGAIKSEKVISLVKRIGKSPHQGKHTPKDEERNPTTALYDGRETNMNERTNGNDVIVLGLEKHLE